MLESKVVMKTIYPRKTIHSVYSLPKFILGGRVFCYVTIAKKLVGRFGRERIDS